MSCGLPNSFSIFRASFASFTACFLSKQPTDDLSSGVFFSLTKPFRSTMRSIFFSDTVLEKSLSFFLLTTNLSGVTLPETRASPSPKQASITMLVRLPVMGSTVNMTPEVSAAMSDNERLDNYSHIYCKMIEAISFSILVSAQRPKRGPAFFDGFDAIARIGYAQVSIVLTGEGMARQIFGGAG